MSSRGEAPTTSSGDRTPAKPLSREGEDPSDGDGDVVSGRRSQEAPHSPRAVEKPALVRTSARRVDHHVPTSWAGLLFSTTKGGSQSRSHSLRRTVLRDADRANPQGDPEDRCSAGPRPCYRPSGETMFYPSSSTTFAIGRPKLIGPAPACLVPLSGEPCPP